MVSRTDRSRKKRRTGSKISTHTRVSSSVRNDVESEGDDVRYQQRLVGSCDSACPRTRADLMEAELALAPPDASGDAPGSSCSDQQCGKELLPGLPNEITVDHVLSRLSRKSLHSISSLNHAWQGLFQSGLVYNALVRAGNVQTLIVVTNSTPKPEDMRFRAISIYDPFQDAWHLLPPIPGVEEGLPSGCQCVVFKGKLFVLGGVARFSANVLGGAIFMLDLGCYLGSWKQVGTMECRRQDFACLVLDDGFCVFGGMDVDRTMYREASVYDPEQASWTRLPDMLQKRAGQKVVAMDGGFCVYGGNIWCEGGDGEVDEGSSVSSRSAQMETKTEMYDPRTRNWFEVNNFILGRQKGPYLSVEGELYHISYDSVDVFDRASNSWEKRQLNFWRVLDKVEVRALWPTAASFVDGELFILLAVEERVSYTSSSPFKVIPMKSVGFRGVHTKEPEVGGSRRRESSGDNLLVWQQVGCPFGFGLIGETNCSILPIQLGAY